ncbi:MAG TPA: 3'-5' exonuclease, partial [Verrucomicrobiae bacterium]|nr:3'-5' exonuclease [Verrucomicrobiae bacterium]
HWMRAPLLTLLRLARQFADRFHAEKIERGVVDFHDLEQFALRLLWDAHAQQPSAIAREWQGRFEAIFVDEYQDINAAQDLIISALSKTGSKSNSPVADDVRSLTLSAPQNSGRPQKGRRGKRRDSATQPLLNLFVAEGIRSETPHSVSDDLHSRGNRFLVGDVKQSIYRFRQADPAIFRKYLARADWEQVPLSENFRSHESILRFINPLFAWLMKPVFGGLEYTPEAQLRFGASAERAEMQRNSGDKPRVELHLLFTDQEPEEPNGDEEENAGAEIESPELEARLVAKRLRELKESGLQIYHEKEKRTRAAEWKDMVILLRAAKNKLETYSKAFAAAGVPLQTKRNAFFATQEVLDLCNVLNILDNPLQDIPLAAVLRSPMVGLEANELALIRIKSDRRPFWKALNHFFESKIECSAASKIELFLNRYHRWRDGRRCSSLAQRLEQILTETGYTDWLLRQSRGRERYANVGQLLRVARHFDESRGESLYLFLRHIEEIQESFGDIEPAALVEENAVRLMTVHQSKGLEFPIVAVADLGKQFNFTDQISQILLHEKYGLCSMIKPPQTGQRYPSLPLWAARRGERLEAIGEEMRILYVALTRAQNHLLLFGSATQKRAEKWDGALVEHPFPKKIIQMRSWLDWLGTHLAKNAPSWMNEDQGETETFGYTIHRQVLECGNRLPLSGAATCPDLASRLTEADLKTFREKPAWPYPHQPATREPAKTSVTLLRKRAESFDEEAMELARRFRRKAPGGKERGLATHAFLEHLDLNGPFSVTALQAQTQNLVQQKLLTPEQAEDIGFDSIAAFWNSETGRELLATKQELKRELPFTYKLTAEDLHAAQLSQVLNIPAGEFVIIQGVADLVRIAKSEIWLIDFKTDSLKPNELPAAIERYRPQLTLYALAFASIYQRPVTRRGLYFLDASELVWF